MGEGAREAYGTAKEGTLDQLLLLTSTVEVYYHLMGLSRSRSRDER